ncbi:hypothetical protein GCM10009647_077500 [Streptomyces sanglieri]
MQPLPVHVQRIGQLLDPAAGRHRAAGRGDQILDAVAHQPRQIVGTLTDQRLRADRQPRHPLPGQHLALPEVAVQQQEFGGVGDQLLTSRERRGDQRLQARVGRRARPHRCDTAPGPFGDRLETVPGRRLDPQPAHRPRRLQQRLRLRQRAQ